MNKIINEPRFNIGTKYFSSGKFPRICTVTDILKTYNFKGELVKISYQSIHHVLGQIVTNRDVCDATIAIGKFRMEEKTQ